MSKTLKRILDYKAGDFENLAEHYASLKDSQKPQTLILTCSDSRLVPHEFLNAKAGELFVVRNAGNLVAENDAESPSNEALTIEYGVLALGVKELIVLGHTSCGAMAGLMDTDSLEALPLVKKGLESYKAKHKSEIESCSGLDDLIVWNVKQQVKNLMSYAFIRDRVKSGDLVLTGAVYDFSNAKIVFEETFQS